MNDTLKEFAGKVKELIGLSRKPTKRLIDVHLIVNPKAGRFRRESTIDTIVKGLEEEIIKIKHSNHYTRYIHFDEYHTEYEGHADEFGQKIASEPTDSDYKLIIVASGDGGYNEVCSGILKTIKPTKDIRLLHVPLGSGNDTAEVKDIRESYGLITGSHKVKNANAVKISDSAGDVSYAFNIASIGLDGYVAHVANEIKKVFGETSYWVASKIAPISYYLRKSASRIDFFTVYNDKGTIELYQNNHLITAMGAKGNSEYGHGMQILPDENNVCTVQHMNLLRLLQNEPIFYKGQHGILPEVNFYKSNRIEFKSTQPLWLQRDGQTCQVSLKQYPLIFEIIENCIKKVIPE
jgi:diacylglycerol kinase family enzyme